MGATKYCFMLHDGKRRELVLLLEAIWGPSNIKPAQVCNEIFTIPFTPRMKAIPQEDSELQPGCCFGYLVLRRRWLEVDTTSKRDGHTPELFSILEKPWRNQEEVMEKPYRNSGETTEKP